LVPKINHRGHSFKGVTAYLMHDKDSQTSERIAWSETGNMHTNNIEKAALVMAYTDKNADLLKRDFSNRTAGRKANAGNVYHYSLSWAHTEKPDRDHQRNQALATLERLGLENHQYYMVSHSDTDHGHVHIVANLTHPETGKIHAPSFDKRTLQAWALEYELEHGIHCKKREENAAKRTRGEDIKHQDKKQDYSRKVTRAYYASDSGKAFIHALKEEGLALAKARRGHSFVIVDDKGDIQKLARQLDIEAKGKLKTAAIKSKLSDIERETLKNADELSREIKEAFKPYDRDAEEIKQQKSLADAAEKSAEKKIEAQDKAAAMKSEQAKQSGVKKKQKSPSSLSDIAIKTFSEKKKKEKTRPVKQQKPEKTRLVPENDNTPPAANENRKQIYDDAHLKKIDEDRERWAKEDLYKSYRLEKEKELNKFYRLDERKTEYAKAQKTWKKGQGFVARLTGKTSKLAEEMRLAKLNLENSQMRYKEEIGTFNRRLEKEKPEYIQKSPAPEKKQVIAPKLRPNWEKAQNPPEPKKVDKAYTMTKGMSADQITLEKARYRKQEIEKYKQKQQEKGHDHGMER